MDAAAAGLTFQDWAALMEQEGYKVEKGKYLAQVIGMDSIQIFTNKDVTVQSLNRDQVRGIFTQHCPVRFLHEQFPGFVDSACQADRVAFVIH